MKNYQTIVMVLVAAVLGYFVGMNFPINKQAGNAQLANSGFGGRNMMQGSQNQTGNVRGGGTGAGNAAARGGMMGARPVAGEIIALDDKSMTIKLDNNTSRIVLFDTGAIINKVDTGTAADLKVGEKVAAFGTQNTDGTMTAQNVQINPQFQIGTPGNGTTTPAPAK